MQKAFLLSSLTKPKCDYKCASDSYREFKVDYDYTFWYAYDQSFDPNSPLYNQTIPYDECKKCDSSCLECTMKPSYCSKCRPGQRIANYPTNDFNW